MTLDMTSRAPSEFGIWRGSDCPLQAPCLNPGSRRWLTRCMCWTRRGHWHDHLPSSCSLRQWRLHSVAGCGESQSHANRPVNGCSAPPSHPGGAPSPCWGHPSSSHRPRIDPSSGKVVCGGWSSCPSECWHRVIRVCCTDYPRKKRESTWSRFDRVGGISPYLFLWIGMCPSYLSPPNGDLGSTQILTLHFGAQSQTVSQLNQFVDHAY
jgi:hypothetical protein